MPTISIPSDFSTDLSNVLRAIVDAITAQEIRVGTTDTARNLADGDFALISEDNTAYLYVKLKGSLFRVALERVEENPKRIVYSVPGIVEPPPREQLPKDEAIVPPRVPPPDVPPEPPPEPPEPSDPGPS